MWISQIPTTPTTSRLSFLAGAAAHHAEYTQWEGQEPFKQGDVMGLLLDCDAGTLAVKKNGVRLGVAFTGLAGELC
jgi:hypothetical protein